MCVQGAGTCYLTFKNFTYFTVICNLSFFWCFFLEGGINVEIRLYFPTFILLHVLLIVIFNNKIKMHGV